MIKYLAEIARRFPIPVLQIPLLPQEIKGLEALTELGDQVCGRGPERVISQGGL
ncbi:MAG TPA: hypothetical protein VF498_00780 [Anaerolineales bacterium]